MDIAPNENSQDEQQRQPDQEALKKRKNSNTSTPTTDSTVSGSLYKSVNGTKRIQPRFIRHTGNGL
jgi:hypothetical protein